MPTFVWATASHAGRVSPGALESPGSAGRAYLRSLAGVYHLTAAQVERLPAPQVHDTGRGAKVVRFRQEVNGVEVFRNQLSVVMDRNLELVAISGYLAPGEMTNRAEVAPKLTSFALPASDAVARGFAELSGVDVGASSFVQTKTEGAGYSRFALEGASVGSFKLQDAPRAKQIYFMLADRLEPAWYVELSGNGDDAPDSQMFSFVFSAQDGALLMRNNLTADHTYRMYADATSLLPFDGPQGNAATPHPTGTPNGYQEPWVPSTLVTLTNYPFSRNDPWLSPGATMTSGNNVEAYLDAAEPDGFQPATDLHATTTAPGTFDYLFNPDDSPIANNTQISAGITSLFYMNNWLHDWFYDSGFDEQWGNAQAFNYGRGGLEGDSIKAEAQDYDGRNNANMSTPADGARPRMQMFVFDGVPDLKVTAPTSLVGNVAVGTAAFGATTYDVNAPVAILNPAGITEGCSAFPAGTFTGKVALIDRGTCNFAVKAQYAQDAGAVAVLIANNQPGIPPGMANASPPITTITVPVLSVTQSTANAWKAANPAVVSVSMRRVPQLDRDGTLDNGIVAHEWGHYLSNRLIGNANGLVNIMGRGMGEGWSDFVGMLMQVRDEDRLLTGNAQFQGVYSVAGYAKSGGASDAYYYGIRRVPYSTDFAKNALTFKHIQSGTPLPTTHPIAYGQNGASNSEVHASGEVWASMLWDCYVSLLNAYPFAEAQERMKTYLVLGLKLTPVAPTLLEARDALLAAAQAYDPADYARFLNAFARRGAGLGAFGPDRNSQDLIPVLESYSTGSNLYVEGMKLDDTVVGCDQDGVLDVGETGNFTVTVRNTGGTTLAAFLGTVTASGASSTFTFPAGNALSFPSLAPGQSATASIRAELAAVSGTAPATGFTVAFDEPTLPASVKTATFNSGVNYDELAGSTTDRFDTPGPTWDRSPTYGSYQWSTTNGSYAHAPNAATVSDLSLTTPWLKVNPTGNFTFTIKHRWSFESTNGLSSPFYDGGVIEISTDGVTWYDLYLDLGIYPGYNYFLAAGDNPLSERAAFAAQSTSFPSWRTMSVNLGTMFAGQNVRLRFRVGSDSGVGAYGWDIDELSFANIANAPFASRSLEATPTTCNRRPVAIVGPTQSVAEGTLSGGTLTRTTVTLDGSGSYDPDGEPLTYQWIQTAGPAVTLTGGNAASATFATDVPATLQYTFLLVVSDGVEQSLPKTVNVYVSNVNRAPVAVATGPGTVLEGSAPTVTLDGSGSSDADGEALTWAWTQTAGPAVQLADADKARPSFPLPSVAADTTYTFQLVVSDGIAASAATTVSVVVQNVNLAPTVNAGSDFNVAGRAPVTLTAVGGDPDGDALTYSWTQTAGPQVTLTDASTATATFTSPDVKTASALTFQVTASDGALQATDTVVVNVAADAAPVANAGSDRNTPSRGLTVLYGSGSDSDGDALTYAWTQLSGPPVVLNDATTATATFNAPSVTTETALAFQLTVAANGLSATDTVIISVQAEGIPTADAGTDQTVPGRTGVVIVGQGSSPDGSAVSYAWTQLAGPNVSLTGANTNTLRFTSPDLKTQEGLTFQLTVSAHGQTATDTVSIIVQADGAPVANAGEDLNVDARSLVTLRGSATDPEHDPVSFQWIQNGGELVTLSDATVAEPTFTAPNVMGSDSVELRFQLVATANGLTSAADEVIVLVHRKNRIPVVTGPNDVTIDERARVTLDASATDPDGDPIAWHWVRAGGPEITLENADTASVSFTAPEVLGDTLVALEVWTTDEAGEDSAVATVRVLVKNVNREPVVTLTAISAATSGERVVLDASGSTDADGDALTYAWKQTSGPTVTLEGSTKAVATFIAPSVETAQTVAFQVIVKDAAGVAAMKTAEVRIDPVKTSGCGCATTNDDSGWANLALLIGVGLGVVGMRRRRFFA